MTIDPPQVASPPAEKETREVRFAGAYNYLIYEWPPKGQCQRRPLTARAHALCDRARNGADCGLDLLGSVIAAESKAKPLSAHVGDDVCAREPIMDRLCGRQFEGQEMPARHVGRNRGHQPGIAERLDLGARELVEKEGLQRQHVCVERIA